MATALAQQENQLLAALPRKEMERLRPHLEPVTLSFGAVLIEAHRPISHVYFPRQGILSMVVSMSDGETAEVGMVGNEGMAGLAAFLGGDQALFQTMVRTPGEAWRMKARTLKDIVRQCGPLHDLLSRYSQALLAMISQSTACNLLHPASGRLRRWLLMAHDRMASNQFQLTQEFIASLLGVSRPTLSIVASSIQRAGQIRYRRGKISILDRAGLEKETCPCYGVIRDEYRRLLGPTPRRPAARA